MSNLAVAYCRSSKDRSDVSIDAQRRALRDMAEARGLVIVAEFTDAVESGKDDDRPGFQALLRAIRERGREWQHIIALDTSRIARRRHLALVFEHEAEKAGIAVHYRNVPDADPITTMLLKSILQAMDEWHSLTSRAKGLAGMAENVRQGWRAGGRAPRGYALEYVPTGAVREGVPVTKSRLVRTAEADQVAAYLRARADGERRGEALSRLRLTWPASTLIGMEWQALTYAGHTVWNVHAERAGGATIAGTKRRPRADWLIQRGTHEALITEDEAERILASLEAGRQRYTRAGAYEYLLAGILVAPDGTPWHGDGRDGYRLGKGRRIAAARIEDTVLDSVGDALLRPESVERVTEAIQRLAGAPADPKRLRSMERAIDALTARIGRTVDLATKAEDSAPFMRRVAELEAERETTVAELARMRADAQRTTDFDRLTSADVATMLESLIDDVRSQREAGDVRDLREALTGLVDRVELDAAATACTIHFRIGGAGKGGVVMASPRGFEPRYLP